MRIHLDTDLGGDPDDACALAMLLGWPEVEMVGITTTTDPGAAGRATWPTAWSSPVARTSRSRPGPGCRSPPSGSPIR